MDLTQRVRLYGDTQIKGDSPELVEYTGMKNLINDVKDSVKLENGKLLFVGGAKLMFSKLRRTIRAYIQESKNCALWCKKSGALKRWRPDSTFLVIELKLRHVNVLVKKLV
ncbi:hypothetical protein HID58_056604 [Brassica napus]|uniref:Uncharacterized protein n=1 Tax=Brassica napus TaxID=3708 RepID=A0ABQ8AQA4_BRANA|nr:hypothetical protein HID58_056604 [Brassica napus]